MKKRPRLYSAPEPIVKTQVVGMSGIRSAGPAACRDVAAPWPRQVRWRDALRRIKKTED
jgi:hypothetical protein